MEIIIELLLQVVGEVLFEGVFEGLGWLLRRRWRRLVSGVLLGFGGGLVWSAIVGHAEAPVVGTILIVAQAPQSRCSLAVRCSAVNSDEMCWSTWPLIGAAVVAGRWMGWLAQ